MSDLVLPGPVRHEVDEIRFIDAVVEVPVEGQVHGVSCDVTAQL